MAKSLSEHIAEVRRAIPLGKKAGAQRPDATAAIDESVDLSTYRSISPEERALIEAMLIRSDLEALRFLPQLEHAMVQLSCTCGCPTFDIAPAPEEMRVDSYRRNIVADLLGELSDGTVGLILWQAGGKLTCLEVYDLAGRDKPYGLPPADTLYPFEETSKQAPNPGAPPSRS